MPTCSLVSYDGPLGNDPAMNRMLAQYHAREGFNINYLAQDLHDCPAPDLILADADDSSFPRILKAVQRLRHRFADTDLNVYIHSPRINEVADLEQIGVRRVLPKPFFY